MCVRVRVRIEREREGGGDGGREERERYNGGLVSNRASCFSVDGVIVGSQSFYFYFES